MTQAPDWAVQIPPVPGVHPSRSVTQLEMPFTQQQLEAIGEQIIEGIIKQVILAMFGSYLPAGWETQLQDYFDELNADISTLSTLFGDLASGDVLGALTIFFNLLVSEFSSLPTTLQSDLNSLFSAVSTLAQDVLDALLSFLTGTTVTGGTVAALTPALVTFAARLLNPAQIPSLLGTWAGSIDGSKIIGAISSALVTGLLDLSNIPDLPASQITSGTFTPGQIPTLNNLLGTLTSGQVPNLPISQITSLSGYLTNLSSGGSYGANLPISQITSLAGYLTHLNTAGVLDAVTSVTGLSGYLGHLNSTTGVLDAVGSVTGLTGYLTNLSSAGVFTDFTKIKDAAGTNTLSAYLANLNSSGVLALAGLASGALPAGVTLPGGQITGAGSIAASLLASLDASKITTGTFSAALIPALSALSGTLTSGQIPALDASKITTGVFGTGQIPNITKAMSTDLQATIDAVYQAINGGATTGNTAASVKTSLQNIPGANIISALSATVIPALDASKITTGTLGAAQIPALPSGWGKTIDSSLLVNAIASTLIPNLDASKITTGAFATARIPNITIGMSTDLQSLVDNMYQAIYGGTSTGNTIASIKTALGVIPGANIVSLAATKLTAGAIPAGVTLPGSQLTGSVAAALISGVLASGNIPNVTVGMSTDMQTIVDNVYQAINGGVSTGNTLASVKTSLSNIPGANIVSLAATKLTAGALAAGVTLPGSQLTGSVAASLVSGALSGATLAATALTSGAIPSGVTLPGSQLTGSVAAGLVSGVLATGNIPNVTAAMSTDLQAVVDNIYQAIHGGTTTGNLVSTVKSSLQAIPGSNLTGSVAASLVSGALSGATLAATALTTGAIPAGVTLPGGQVTGTLAQTQIPSLTSSWTGTLDGSRLAGSVAAGLVSGVLATGNIPALAISGVTGLAGYLTNLNSSGVYGGSLPISQITSLAGYLTNLSSSGVLALAGLGAGSLPAAVTLPGGQLTGSVAAGLISGVTANEQNITDYIYQAIHGGTSTGNALTTIKSSLQAIPGANLTGTVAASLISGALSGATLAATALTSGAIPAGITLAGSQLSAGAIPAGVTLGGSQLSSAIAAANVPSLSSGWAGTIDGSRLAGSVAGSLVSGALSGATLAASALTSGAIGAGVTLPGGQVTGLLGSAQIPALPSGWGKTIDGSLLAGSVTGSLVSGALSGATLAASALTSGAVPSGVTIDAARITSGVLGAAQIPAITSAMAPALAPIDTLVQAWGMTGTGHTTTDLTTAAQNLPTNIVTGILGAANVGNTIQNQVDATVQGIVGGTATGNSLATLTNSFVAAVKNFLGYNPGGSTPAGSVAASVQSSGAFINNTAYFQKLKGGLDMTANGPWDISQIFASGATLPTLISNGPTAASYIGSQVAFVPTVNAGLMKCVRWLGYPTGGTMANITAIFINIWKMNTTTGVLTAVYNSPNIVASVGTGTAPAWQFYALPTGAQFTASQTDVYAVEIQSWGSGNYNVVGLTPSAQLPAAYTSKPALPGGSRGTYVFSSSGSGAVASTAPKSGVASITCPVTNNNCDSAVIAFALTSCTTTGDAYTMTYAGQPMTFLGQKGFGSGNNKLQAFICYAPFGGAGAQTLQLNQTVAGKSWYGTIWGLGLWGVTSVDTANIASQATLSSGNTSMPFSYSANPNAFHVVAAFTDSGGTISSTSGFTQNGAGVNTANFMNILAGYSYPLSGTAAVNRAAGNSGIMVVPCICAGSITNLADPASTNAPLAYYQMPWVGLSNTTGTSQSGPPPPPPPIPPQQYTFTTVGTTTWTPPSWCNYLDIVAFSGGNGGDAGGNIFGSWGGACGNANETQVPRASITGALTIQVGGGGYGGGSPGVPGGGGGSTVVTIPGVGTLTVAGPATRSSVSSTATSNFGAGQDEPNVTYNGNTYPGGAAGKSAQAAGSQPGGGGGGGNAGIGTNTAAGPGGAGIVYILAYQ